MINQAKKDKFIEEHFFRPKWYSVFINPYFINRYKLLSEIRKFAATVSSSAKILDVGCGSKPYRSLFISENYIGIDIQGGGHSDSSKTVDKYYDGIHIPFADKSFDTVICTQVLEHSVDPNALISECSRIMTSGATVFLSMPFIYPEHEVPYDFRRFTRFGHKQICESNGLKIDRVIKTTGLFGTFAQLLSLSIFESILFRSTVLKGLLSVFILAPIQLLGLLLDTLTRKGGPTMDYVIIARKI